MTFGAWRVFGALAAALAFLPAFAAAQERLGEKTVARNDAIGHYQYSVRHLSGHVDTRAGEVSTPYSTLENLAVEWEIEGDDNLNGIVTVADRKSVV